MAVNQRPDYWGIWANENDNMGVFFVLVHERRGTRVLGRIFDDLGVADFEGRISETGLKFKKRYCPGSKPQASNHLVHYVGERTPEGYTGTYRTGKQQGTFNMEVAPRSATLDNLFNVVVDGKSLLYRC